MMDLTKDRFRGAFSAAFLRACWLAPSLLPRFAGAQPERVIESLVPSLAYGAECSSTIELRNLSDRAVTVDVEGHRASGALVGLAGRDGATIRLAARERGSYKLDIVENTNGAWVRVREHIPSTSRAPSIAVSATTECVVDNQLRTIVRDISFPMHNPSFSSEVAQIQDGIVALINASERPARVWVCYFSGNYYSVPAQRGPPEWKPVCSTASEVQVPPFGSREFPVMRPGSSHLMLKTVGEMVVLELLRPLQEKVRLYVVDSSVRFMEEPGGAARD